MTRSMLREYSVAAFYDLAGRDAHAVLSVAPSPEQGLAFTVTRVESPAPQSRPTAMAPVTRVSGIKRVVLARNRRLAGALYQQAFAALKASAGARAYYDRHRAGGATHHIVLWRTASSAFSTVVLLTTPSTSSHHLRRSDRTDDSRRTAAA
ncbi:hypothetical protein GQ85_14285 [Rhodococcus rhodochrous]|nr:hypothetical protein GQ85_14285 [Rhodococcus rhodochrous]